MAIADVDQESMPRFGLRGGWQSRPWQSPLRRSCWCRSGRSSDRYLGRVPSHGRVRRSWTQRHGVGGARHRRPCTDRIACHARLGNARCHRPAYSPTVRVGGLQQLHSGATDPLRPGSAFGVVRPGVRGRRVHGPHTRGPGIAEQLIKHSRTLRSRRPRQIRHHLDTSRRDRRRAAPIRPPTAHRRLLRPMPQAD